MALHLPWGKQENQGQCDVKEGQRSHGVWGATGGFQNLVREYGYRSWPLIVLRRGNSSVTGRQELRKSFLWICKSFNSFTRVKSGDPPLCYGFFVCVLLFWEESTNIVFPSVHLDSLKYHSPLPIKKILKLTQYFHVWELAYMNIKRSIKTFFLSNQL